MMENIRPFPKEAIERFSRITSNGAHTNGEHEIPYQLRGSNAIEYATRVVEADSCLLANRYLTRGSGMFFVAPSGQGKSTAVMQMMVCWACGRESFEIAPSRPLRIIMIQAEDDDADLTDMAKVVDHLGFSQAERQRIAANSWIETINDKIGLDAIRAIEKILELRACDLLILNPYLAYLGADSKDEEANSTFLRAYFQALLNRYRIAALVVHHTPKTNFRHNTAKWSTMDWMYSGAGAAVLTNWARAILAMDPLGESGVFKFIAAKRHQRIGWEHTVNYFRHDQRPGVLLWTKATAAEIANATSSAKNGAIARDTLIELIPVCDGISIDRLHAELKKKGFSEKTRKSAIALAIEDGDIHIGWIWPGGRGQKRKMIYRGADDLFPNEEKDDD
jgi:hypothetical protein